MRRNRLVAVSAALLMSLTLGVAGCSSTGSSQSSEGGAQSESQSGSADSGAPEVNRDPKFALPEVTGAFGETPVIKPLDDTPPKELVSKVLQETDRDGAVVKSGDTVYLNYAGVLWDGTTFDSSFDRGAALALSLNTVIAGWKYGLEGTKVGDRVLLVVPPEYGYGQTAQGNIPADSTLIFVVDILDVANTQALKEATPTNAELPAGMLVEGELGSEPRVVFEEGVEAPTEEQTIVVADGPGAVVTAADSVVYHYVGTYWGSDQKAVSTWDTGVEMIPAGQNLFLGEKVGSRLVMIFPSETEGQPAMVMLVDILAAYPE